MEIKLHDIGEGMTEAEVTHFLVKPGDKVAVDQPMVEVQTDKMTAEIPAPRAGVVKELKVEEGNTISIGTTVLLLEAEDAQAETAATVEAVKEEPEVQEHEATEAEVEYTPTSPGRRVKAAPFTRKVARELGVYIEEVEGTGKWGRITVEDVKRHAEGGSSTVADQQETPEAPEVSSAPTLEAKTVPFRGRRKQIAKKMTQSLFTIPHCTHFEEIDVTNLIELRNELKQMDTKISATAFFIKAISIALKEFEVFNAKLDEKEEVIRVEAHHNIGVATDTEDGLIVPVIHQVEKKSLKQIHQELKQLTQKALEGKLTSKELTGGTFTISNVGPLGGSIGATPIINHPEVGLMAFHKTKERPEVYKGEIAIRSMMNISMVFDHRVTDGGTAVAFTNKIQRLIENPNTMMIDLI
ncbi:dihydrolipoamide acetyltransferase family protein [Thalassobacillus hwangdonensis]|uniref:Dihydrolipoamide acetyltransferase component of pyruvate dehydrogenase complex n=1 Tax=Thalassobacillus hwangdonensis TaxID=546108 RepID=A0ABW3L141_9BACI